MAWQKQQRPQTGAQEESVTFEWTGAQHDDLDEVLDEIDSVLEVNAEEFVRSFVQKGGE